MSALDKQVNGNHYKQFEIQPIEFITKNNIPFIEGNVIKYICRWRDKNGLEDLDKVIHYVELLKELENGRTKRTYGSKARVKTLIQGWSRQLGSYLWKKNQGAEADNRRHVA
jgi:hypothetical protein